MRFTLKPSRRAVTAAGALIVPGALAAGLLALPAQSSTSAVGRAHTPISHDGPAGASRVSSLIDAAQLDRPAPNVAAKSAPVPVTEPYSPSKCEELYGRRCYELGTHISKAYGIDKLHARGWQGEGATIAVLLPFRNRHVQGDLDKFSDRNGLPRTKVERITMPGTREVNPAVPGEVVCAVEGTVDLEILHTVAPKAKLIYVETPEGESLDGGWLQSISDAMEWLVTRRKVDVISMSYGTYERNARDAGINLRREMRRGLIAAAARNVTLVAATGNTGPTGPDNTGQAFFTEPTVAWPAGDPLVLATGGARIHLDDQGTRTAPDEVWTAEKKNGIDGATGGGISEVWDRPSWQPRTLGRHRAIPDMASNASPTSAMWLYSTYQAFPDQGPGWFRVGGTSLAAPIAAGAAAAAVGRVGHRLGLVGPALYAAARNDRATGLTDLDDPTQCNTANGVAGYCASKGYDPTSGLGAIHNMADLSMVFARAGSRAGT